MNGSFFELLKEFNNFLYDNGDPRIRDRFLMGLPYWIILTYIIYLLFIAYLLPLFMTRRSPLNFHKISIKIDFLLLLVSTYFFLISLNAWLFIYNWHCSPILPLNNPVGDHHADFCWQFVITRYIYTLHSLPFVLSKRKSSLANYLLVHHALFPIMTWSIVNFYPGGHATFVGLVNSLTHVMLFGIKFVIIQWPEIKQIRRLFHVVMHIFQFTAIVAHSAQFVFWKDCQVPIAVPIAEITYALIIAAFYYIFVIHQHDSIN